MELKDLTIKSFHEGLLNKEFSALEIAQACFKEIKERDPEINAFLSTAEESAVREAEAADLAVAKNEDVPDLAGAPLAIKDNILIKGLPATAASRILEKYVASYDATVIRKLKKEKTVFLGKTNCDEFAMGSSTENSAFKITRNPHDLTRVPGGSSGGSAAAVAAGFALGALGTDTGGSIREPASFCGVVGLKPTYGAVSRSGAIAMASSLDQIGPIAKTVEDAAIIFKAIAGKDPLDATSSGYFDSHKNELLNPPLEKIKSLTVGLPEEFFIGGTDPAVIGAMEEAVNKLKTLGIRFEKVSLPHVKYALSCYYIIMPAEASSNLARFDGVRYGERRIADGGRNLAELYFRTKGEGFGAEVKRRIILGTFVLSSGYYDAYYEKAQKVRALIKNDFDEAFKSVDVLLAPVAPTPAFKIGERTDDPLSMYLADIFTIPVNLAGLPAISVPVSKRGASGLPVGFQLIGKRWREADILGMGTYYEKI
ncbi:MAG: Asp-tRNA(Asn)/Glu-tRNA(Gln) amidotransferase subunit GatA [Patescibacteria group bacterium]|nr:Asp-tRNA(Asn)/Glu-tRNA(Gln) amidotransferase subunit GatA [Patescibacteria group bacterium]